MKLLSSYFGSKPFAGFLNIVRPLWVGLCMCMVSLVLMPVCAQKVPAGTEKVVVNGVTYYLYKVQKSEGLYRVSVNTQVSQEVIVQHNPEAKDGLKAGQVLRIPVQEPGVSVPVPVPILQQVTESKNIIHTVAPQETLYGISRNYGLTVAELLNENPGIANGQITPGMQLRIPEKGKVRPKNYLKHEVQAGETLYAIARKYQLPAADIRNANPGIDENDIKTGVELTIPIEIAERDAEWKQTLRDKPFTMHEVKKKETLFGISRQYNVTVEQLQDFNTSVDFGNLKKGDALKIPSEKWLQALRDSAAQTTTLIDEPMVMPVTSDCQYQYFVSRPAIKIAILLPFNVAGKHAAADGDDESHSGSKAVSGRSRVVVEFYEGLLLALDAYKKQGVNFELFVYDTTDDLAKVSQILQKPELSTVDLIVGPAHTAHLKTVSDFSKQHGIKMVNPFTNTNSELCNNPNLFQMMPVDTLMWETMARKIVADGAGKRLIVIRSANPTPAETALAELLRKHTVQHNAIQPLKTELLEHVYGQAGKGALVDKLIPDQQNLLFIPSTEELFVSKVVASLESLAGRNNSHLVLYGMHDWLRFQSIEAESIHKLNTRIISYYGIDYQNENTQKVLAEYRALFHTEPFAITPYFQKPSGNGGYSRFGLWGYDIATWFVGALVDYGPTFEHCMSRVKTTLVQSNFRFQRISNWGGFYNNGLVMIHFNSDYSVTPVKVTP
ncbi:LysM domain-containing protein [Breznakibacter xylanolyticus]|uniref:LysM domain-containing protein n=1 Tax=Breznakibacter xylanolyticus TaxID=990 RepID=A0A2W7NV09_9BACT|nr:LysM peptidoglycan-binding domain-containing protein [Breznakibacter xylanolyticus]PZX20434.1 LysM domain-containing protein [Breznakibacter xylanolyticus]